MYGNGGRNAPRPATGNAAVEYCTVAGIFQRKSARHMTPTHYIWQSSGFAQPLFFSPLLARLAPCWLILAATFCRHVFMFVCSTNFVRYSADARLEMASGRHNPAKSARVFCSQSSASPREASNLVLRLFATKSNRGQQTACSAAIISNALVLPTLQVPQSPCCALVGESVLQTGIVVTASGSTATVCALTADDHWTCIYLTGSSWHCSLCANDSTGDSLYCLHPPEQSVLFSDLVLSGTGWQKLQTQRNEVQLVVVDPPLDEAVFSATNLKDIGIERRSISPSDMQKWDARSRPRFGAKSMW